MALGTTVEKVLRLVEARTGLPVHVQPDASLPANLLAKVTMARGKMPFHQVDYQPDRSASPDYLIVFQCGFILRHYGVAPTDRVDFTGTPLAEQTVQDWVQNNPKTPSIAKSSADGLTNFLFQGILSQLRSVPVGMRVDLWILNEYPELEPLQRAAVMKQLEDNVAGLRPQVQAMMPDQALAANLSMSAAYSLFWAEKLGQPQLTLPYRASGHLEAGDALYEIWRNVPSDPGQDRNLIDRWANKLGVQRWYQWVPSQSPA
jgi:hypothetical protein